MIQRTKTISFQEYLDKINDPEENTIQEDWGFYIDIENQNQSQLQKYNAYYHHSKRNIYNSNFRYKYLMTKNLIKHVNIPETIKEIDYTHRQEVVLLPSKDDAITVKDANAVKDAITVNNEKYIFTILGIMCMCLFLVLY